MAMRQYIGARYVLKIYENSLDPQSADWEANTSYEPLTMVNYNNSSYISRKDVPANIGNPVDNPNYWALSGLYNGQIANLQNQINTINNTDLPGLQNQIDIINNTDIPNLQRQISYPLYGKQIAIYGDSWADPNLPYDEWIDVLNAATGTTAHVKAQGGYKLTQIYNSLWDNYNADIYIIMGGINDCLYQETLKNDVTAVTNMIDAMRTINPDAEIFIVTPAKQLQPTNSALTLYYLPFEMYRQMLWHCAIDKHVKVISGLKTNDFTMYLSADGVHPEPTSANLEKVGEWILDGILRNGDSRDYFCERVANANNTFAIIQNGCVTDIFDVRWDFTSSLASIVPFVNNFAYVYKSEISPDYYYSGQYSSDFMSYFDSSNNDITIYVRILDQTVTATNVLTNLGIHLYFSECQ